MCPYVILKPPRDFQSKKAELFISGITAPRNAGYLDFNFYFIAREAGGGSTLINEESSAFPFTVL